MKIGDANCLGERKGEKGTRVHRIMTTPRGGKENALFSALPEGRKGRRNGFGGSRIKEEEPGDISPPLRRRGGRKKKVLFISTIGGKKKTTHRGGAEKRGRPRPLSERWKKSASPRRPISIKE